MYKLMIVDDDEILLEGLGTAFDWAALGVQVTATATDGLSALAEMRAQPCDILITDIKMGRMDGLELTRQVREEFPATRVVIMSAYEEFAYAQQAVRMAVEDYLLKPIELEQLTEIIRKIVQSLDSEREHSEKVEGMHRTLVDLGDHTVDEVFRASGLLNTGLVEHLSRAVALGNDRKTMEDIQLLRVHLREVSGGSFIFLMTTISILVSRLMESNALNEAEQEQLKTMQHNALTKPTLEEALQETEETLTQIALQIAERMGGGTEQLIAQACRYIDEHYAESALRIRDVADAVGLSPSYLSSLFGKYVHESFTDYLVRRRMMEAQNLLSNTDLRTYEVAYQVGCDNPAYFSTMFKNFTGLTVSKYREAFGKTKP